MSRFLGYKNRAFLMTGSAVTVVPSGVPVCALTFINHSAAVVVFSGTDLKASPENELVMRVPANDSRVLDAEFFCTDGMKFTSTAGAEVVAIYGSSR